jgi:hypothetical protein
MEGSEEVLADSMKTKSIPYIVWESSSLHDSVTAASISFMLTTSTSCFSS